MAIDVKALQSARGKITPEQQQSFIDKNKEFDFAKYWLTVKKPPQWINNLQTVNQTQQQIQQPQVKPQVVKYAAGGKWYEINVWPWGEASFESKWWLGTRTFKTLDEAKAAIEAWNRPTPLPKIEQPKIEWPQLEQPKVEWPKIGKGKVIEGAKITEAPKVETPKYDYETNDPTRLAEIKSNLENAAIANPESFESQAKFDEVFNYNLRSQAQKDVLDSFWVEKGKRVMYDNMTVGELASWAANGNFSSTDLDYLKTSDPTRYAQFQEAYAGEQQKISSKLLTSSLNSLLWDKDNNGVSDYIDEITKKSNEAFATYQNYVTEQTSPEMTWLQEEMTTLDNEIKTATLDQIKIKDDIEKQYGSLPKSLFNAILSDATSDLQDQITRKTMEYNAKLGIYNSKLSTIQAKYDLETKRIEAETTQLTGKLTALQTMMNIQATQAAISAKAVDPRIWEVINIGTTKKPQYMQWNTETQTYDIPLTPEQVSAWVGVSVWWLKGVWWVAITPEWESIMWDTLNVLNNATFEQRRGAMLWAVGGFVSPNVAKIQSAYDYLVNNLSLKSFLEIKKMWWTFGSMTEGERALVKGAATRLRYAMSDADWKREIWIIRKQLNIAANRTSTKTQSAIQPTTTTGWEQYQTPMNMSIANPLDPSWSKLVQSRIK